MQKVKWIYRPDTPAGAGAMNLFSALEQATCELSAQKNYQGAKKTIKRLYKDMTKYLNIRAVNDDVNIKIHSIFFDMEQSTLHIYSIISGDTRAAIQIKRVATGIGVICPEDCPTYIGRKLALMLKTWINAPAPAWIYNWITARLAPSTKIEAAPRPITPQEKTRLREIKKEKRRINAAYIAPQGDKWKIPGDNDPRKWD